MSQPTSDPYTRPAAELAPATRQALIRAGRRLFAERGYDGASVRAITRAASANLGSITYHFGSKRALYGAVVSESAAPLVARVTAAAGVPGAGALDRVEAVVRAFFAALAEMPELPQLILQEMAVGRDPPAEAVAAVRGMLAALRGVIETGQEEGAIRAGDPTLFAVSLVSQPLHMTLLRRMVRAVAGLDVTEPAARQPMVDHAVAFVRRGVAAVEGGEA